MALRDLWMTLSDDAKFTVEVKDCGEIIASFNNTNDALMNKYCDCIVKARQFKNNSVCLCVGY